MNVKQIINPKDTLGVVWLYILGSVFWLAVAGISAMNLRTYLTYDLNSPQVGVIYYTLLTLHGWAGVFGFVNMAPAAIIAFSMYKSKLSIVHTKQMTILFWLANIFLALALIGGPDMGWYEYPPQAIEDTAAFKAFTVYSTPLLMGMGYLFVVLATLCQTIMYFILIIDAYLTKPRDEKLNIFAAYGVAFAMVIALTLPALTAANMWYALHFFFNVPVDPLLWVILFWFYGHPVVYYVPFPLFGALYYYIPIYAGRPLYSEKWARWNIYLLSIGTMAVWVHHLQTWPLPIIIRFWVTASTLLLASGSGLTVMNLGLTILTSQKYNYRDPVGLGALIALIGFILAGAQALVLPVNSINPIFHNTYYVVGHFHLMIWTLIVMGFSTVFLDMLRSSAVGFNFSADVSRWIRGGMILWTASFMPVGYLMSYIGYSGMLRRMIAYPSYFQPFNIAESLLAELGIPGLLVVISAGVLDFLRYSTSVSTKPVSPPPASSPSFTMEVRKNG
jgi:cytochrome aa3-600 menaquinol oxidase subunit 1